MGWSHRLSDVNCTIGRLNDRVHQFAHSMLSYTLNMRLVQFVLSPFILDMLLSTLFSLSRLIRKESKVVIQIPNNPRTPLLKVKDVPNAQRAFLSSSLLLLLSRVERSRTQTAVTNTHPNAGSVTSSGCAAYLPNRQGDCTSRRIDRTTSPYRCCCLLSLGSSCPSRPA